MERQKLFPNITKDEIEDIDKRYEDMYPEDVDTALKAALDTPPESGTEEITDKQIVAWMSSAPSRCDSIGGDTSEWPSRDYTITFRAFEKCGEAESEFVIFIVRPKQPSEGEDFIGYGSIVMANEEDWAVVDYVLNSLRVYPDEIDRTTKREGQRGSWRILSSFR